MAAFGFVKKGVKAVKKIGVKARQKTRDKELASKVRAGRIDVPAPISSSGISQSAFVEQAKLSSVSDQKNSIKAMKDIDFKKIGIAVVALLALIFVPKLIKGKKKTRR